jgi:GDP-mannose 6-dehydrogenase
MGYVGCVSAACLSRDGHRVIGVDVNADKVDAINRGVAPVSEPGLGDLVLAGVQAGTLRATSDAELAVEQSDVALVTVGTPSRRDGSVDSSAVERVVRIIGTALRGESRQYTIVIRSTLLPGILEDRLAPALSEACGLEPGGPVQLCNNPEFLREVTAIRDYNHPPFILVGADDESAAAEALALYEGIEAERIVTDTRTAALVKYACNSFHAIKIAFANEIGALARLVEADGARVMDIVCRDRQLNISTAYLKPGFAFGGSCLPKDLRAMTRIAQREGSDLRLLASVLPSNDAHLERAVELIEEHGCRAVGLVGLSFKAGTDDLRESPLVKLAETLYGKGFDLRIYDPHIRVPELLGSNLSYVDQHLPHLSALLVSDLAQLREHAELVVIGSGIADGLVAEDGWFKPTLDLRRDLVSARRPMACV